MSKPEMRIGYGWDSHEFKPSIPLKIGGVTLPHDKGLGGHSDGDVLLHAITDALLGAIAGPDIGSLFPPSDAPWKNADSAVFLREALKPLVGQIPLPPSTRIGLCAGAVLPTPDGLTVPGAATEVDGESPNGLRCTAPGDPPGSTLRFRLVLPLDRRLPRACRTRSDFPRVGGVLRNGGLQLFVCNLAAV